MQLDLWEAIAIGKALLVTMDDDLAASGLLPGDVADVGEVFDRLDEYLCAAVGPMWAGYPIEDESTVPDEEIVDSFLDLVRRINGGDTD